MALLAGFCVNIEYQRRLSIQLGLLSDGFKIDAQISANRMNGEGQMKELEEWQPDSLEDSELHDLGSGNFLTH